MASSPVDIANSALIKLGVEPISSFTEDSKAADRCNRQYDTIRKKTIAEHYWNFSMARATMAIVTGAPSFGFAIRYALPSDYLRAVHLNIKTARFKVEKNKYLHTNLSGAKLLYQMDVEDVSQFPPHFEELLAINLALDLCMALTQKRTLKADLAAERALALRDARSTDGQEGSMDELQADVWIDSRISDPDGDFVYDESI